MMTFIDIRGFYILTRWFVFYAVFYWLAVSTLFAGPLLGAEVGLAGKSYQLEAPIMLGRGPVLSLKKGVLGFPADGVPVARPSNLLPLPTHWPQLFKTEDGRQISVSKGQLVLDLRRGKRKSHPPLLQDLVKTSSLSEFSIADSELLVLTDVRAPLTLPIKVAAFTLDMEDGELEGTGSLKLWGAPARFRLVLSYPAFAKGADGLSPLKLEIKTPHFDWGFEGEIGGQKGLTLKGESQVQLFDLEKLITPVNKNEVDSPASNRKRTDETTVVSGGDTDAADGVQTGERTIALLAEGLLNWSGAKGTLTDGEFIIAGNGGNGSLTLKLTERNHALSGSLAFETLSFEPQAFEGLALKQKAEKKNGEEEHESVLTQTTSGLFTSLFPRFDVEASIKKLVRLVRAIDIDLRVSAETIKLGDLQLNETGFSLYQSQGEAIVDLADVSLYGGQVGGHLKIDTRAPKPRWHVNLNLMAVQLGDFSPLLHTSWLPSGLGDVKFHLTSFGDKLTEVNQNLSGSLDLQMPKGGEINLNLSLLTSDDKAGYPADIDALMGGELDFTRLSLSSRIEGGHLITEHATINTSSHDFTGRGILNFNNGMVDWHIASWAQILAESVPETGENNRGAGDLPRKVPLILSCSRINGPLPQPELEVLTALQLSLLNHGCPAFYHPTKQKKH